ncbi:UNVERIFIED_CONTAM: hypothetical protein HDU68_004471 [Siphonaria sp. JEL0065]|nr:hypothetical protein HDU68_004471 [Siphonaria sp. JEL0065]
MTTPNNKRTVAVIGSGPAGAVAAIALKRQGFEPTLYEKVDPIEAVKEAMRTGEDVSLQFSTIGGGFSVLANGLKALQHLGLYDDILALNIDKLLAMNFMRMDGSDLAVKPTAKAGEIDARHMLRSTFHNAIMKAVHRANIKTYGGKKLINLEQDENGVTVWFEDGTVITADFVVGADGIHSTTRKLVFPEALKPIVFGIGYTAVLDRGTLADGTVVEFDYQMGAYVDGVEGRMVFISRCGPKDGEVFVADMDNSKWLDQNEDWRPVTDLPKETAKLAEMVESWGAPRSVVTCTRHVKRITPANIYDLPDLSTFYKGRVVLVGDAAHGTIPFYGQGLNQALEDAGVLADLWGHFGANEYEKTFALYNKIRVPRVQLCAANARTTAKRMKAGNKRGERIGRFFMKIAFGITNFFGLDDEVYYHDFRDDVKKAVPDIQFV